VPLVRFVVNRFGWVNSVRHPKATNTAASPSIKNALDHRAAANFSETHNFMTVPYFRPLFSILSIRTSKTTALS